MKKVITNILLIKAITITIIILVIQLLFGYKKPITPTPGGDKTFNSFKINSDNIPPNLTYGYSATSWTQSVSTNPEADSIDYSLTNVASDLNGNLSVDTSGSSVSGVKLDLATGVGAGTYTYTIHGVAHKAGYTDATYDKVCSLTIAKIPMPTPTWSTPDMFTYDGSSHSISITNAPVGSTVTYSGGEDGTNGATTTGTYTITANITNPNYQTWTGTHTLTISSIPTFSSVTVDEDNIPTNLIIGYSATSWTQTVTATPTADSIDYSLTSLASGLTGKLDVNTSGSSTTGVKLDLATGVMPGTYSYTVQAVAHKSGYADYTADKVCSLIISNGSFSTFTIDDSTIPTSLVTGYAATSWTQTVTATPTADSIDYSLPNIDAGLNGKLSVNTSGSSTSVVKLDLATGVIPGTYSYTVQGIAHKSGYTDSTTTKTCSLTIANATFSAFTIDNNNIPTNLTYGYSASSWTQTVSTTPTADSIDYTVTNVDTGLSGKLTVDSSSTVSGVKLNLATGVTAGTYAYTVHGVAHKSGYTDSTADKVCSLTIANATFTSFTIDNNNIPTSLVTGYAATSWTQTASTTPTADSIDYSLTSVASGLNGKLTVDSSSTVSGVKLNLATGVAVGTYSYTVHGVAHKSGYTDATQDAVCSLTINGTFSAFTINTNNIPTSLVTGYSAISWDQSVSTTPVADSIDYTVTNVDTGLSGKLSVDSGSTVNGVKLNLATGVVAGTYAYTVHGVAHKSGYNDSITDKTCSLTIGNGTFTLFTINADNIPTNLTYGYSATNWTQTISSSPSPDSVTYTLTNVDTGLNGKLTTSSVATGVKLNLATGVTIGTYAYTVHGVAHKAGYTDATYDKVCSLTIYPTTNCIKLQDGTIHYINTSGSFCTNRTYNGTFDFTDTSGVSQTITRTNIKEIYLIDLPQISTAPEYYLRYLCYGFTNLTAAVVKFPTGITTVNNYFCANMFQACTNLTFLPSGFNLSQNITSGAGYNFCYQMFYSCSSLTSLPSGFNLLTGITGSVGADFCTSMFRNNISLTSLPSSFKLSQGITSVANYFCLYMFRGCSSLTSLPSGFNLPQGITSTGNSFCHQMFDGCSSLKNDNTPTNLVTIHIPNLSGTDYCTNMFMNTGTTNPATPSPDSNVTVNAN